MTNTGPQQAHRMKGSQGQTISILGVYCLFVFIRGEQYTASQRKKKEKWEGRVREVMSLILCFSINVLARKAGVVLLKMQTVQF